MVVLMKPTFASLIVFSVAALGALSAAPQSPTRVVRVTAERFSFTPSEIEMTLGETVEIRVQSDDTAHGFRLAGGDVNLEVPKRGGGEATAVFHPDRAGRYVFECSRMCGAGHDFMRGEVVVRDSPQGRAR
jgi:cytochrome c oxidase subunit II